MHVFVFPGQGSQRARMGERLFDDVALFRDIEDEVDDIAGFSVRELCLEDSDRLNQTRYTQPCLYIVNALSNMDQTSRGARGDCFAGHSLGEYNALLAAGCFDLLDGLRLVRKRAELMSRASAGGMVAVLDLSIDEGARALRHASLGALSIAGYNAPRQFVISGPHEELRLASDILVDAGAAFCLTLPVSGAFHSPLMGEAAAEFAEFLAGFSFRAPAAPVLSNVTGRFYPADSSSGQIAALLGEQIVAPVRWVDGIEFLLRRGATSFTEIGPGRRLTELINQIRDRAILGVE